MKWVRCLDPNGTLVVVNLNQVASITHVVDATFLTYASGGVQPINAIYPDTHETPMAAAEHHDVVTGEDAPYGTANNPIMILPYG